MDAFTGMAGVLGRMTKTPQERRAERNRRYYERNRETWIWYDKFVHPISELAKLFEGARHAHP